jgi:hypothetical protein
MPQSPHVANLIGQQIEKAEVLRRTYGPPRDAVSQFYWAERPDYPGTLAQLNSELDAGEFLKWFRTKGRLSEMLRDEGQQISPLDWP